jgi:hypothetical protein
LAGFSRVERRGPRRRPRAPRAQAPGDDGCRRAGAELVQLVQRAAPGLAVAVGERERRVVRAPDRGPLLGRGPPVAAQLRRVGLGHLAGDLLGDARAPAPQGQLADDPSGPPLARQLERGLRRLHDALAIAAQPGDLGARGGDRVDALQLLGHLRQRQRRVERVRRARVAAPRAHEAQRDAGEDAGDRRRARIAQRQRRRLGGLGPAALLELRARLEALQVEPPQVQARLGAVIQAGGQRIVDDRIQAVAQSRPREVAVAPRDVHLQPGLPRERDAALELLRAGEVLAEQLHRAERVDRMDADLDLVEAIGELERAGAPGGRPVGVLAVHAQARHVRVGQPELAPAGEPLEHGHGLAAEPLGLRAAVAGAEEHVREPTHPVALAQPIAERPVARERVLHRLDRLAAVVGAEGGAEPALEERDPLLGRQIAAEAQRSRVLGGRLAMRADRLGASRRGRRVLEHGAGVAGGLGVVGEPRRIGGAGRRGDERRQRGPVQLDPAVGRERLLDRHAGQLVTERDAVGGRRQHARAQALLQAGELVLGGQRLEQPELGLRL